MESIDYEEEEQIFSQVNQQQQKINHFKQYLVDSGTITHFVKFLFGLRTKQQHDESVPNSDALQMFRQYFGALHPDTTEQDQIRKQIQSAKEQNAQLCKELGQVKNQIEALRAKIQKAKEEKRLREEEEAKNPKKGGKK